ncbi:MAG: hypothetical protein KQJ78_14435 [Deltaproteobacteria bacterium]|nr:hypothetical protein [Deltaproteobacteria bacterium]
MVNDKVINLLLAGLVGSLLAGLWAIPTHPFSGSLAGHAVGILGSILMALTLVYPFRKRVLKKNGKSNPLGPHLIYGLAGPSLVLLHAGGQTASLIGILVYLSLLLVVFSGIVGRYLFKKVSRTVRERERDLEQLRGLLQAKRAAVSQADLENYLDAGLLPLEENRASHLGRELLSLVHSIAESEHALAVFSRTKVLFTRWSLVHRYLTALLFALLLVHVLVTVYYGLRWLP